MNNPELRAVLTEALKAHRIERCSVSSATESSQWGSCSACEFETDSVPFKGVNWDVLCGEITATHHAEIIASLPGVAVIQLPEPYFEATGDEFENGRKDYAFGDVSVFADGEIHLFGAVWGTAAIEEFAAGILAAVAESKRAAAAAVVAAGKEHHG
ncbi:hypothetical protein SEA_CHUCKLY_76 [Mycobacterium phage Chuckly]|uniref:Uncharacterized protein n=1 Tax=Mycobacterium phage Chuckly TaxID=2656569 RepID=A0A649VDN7_9CAUD|nr:hypothetical protein I5H22_gp076 [Mycobacterium phage Chuckly]QGJ90314.1 hypothetical protein SEA_CHUCKLY_76 [Mycobacterium phage Chuckly]